MGCNDTGGDRIELRCAGGPLLGILTGGTALEIRRSGRLYVLDLAGTLRSGSPIVFERLLDLDGPPAESDPPGVAPE